NANVNSMTFGDKPTSIWDLLQITDTRSAVLNDLRIRIRQIHPGSNPDEILQGFQLDMPDARFLWFDTSRGTFQFTTSAPPGVDLSKLVGIAPDGNYIYGTGRCTDIVGSVAVMSSSGGQPVLVGGSGELIDTPGDAGFTHPWDSGSMI